MLCFKKEAEKVISFSLISKGLVRAKHAQELSQSCHRHSAVDFIPQGRPRFSITMLFYERLKILYFGTRSGGQVCEMIPGAQPEKGVQVWPLDGGAFFSLTKKIWSFSTNF